MRIAILQSHGLSILEVLVATTIMAFMGIGVITITDNSLLTKEKVLTEDEVFLNMEMGLTRIEKDFAQIYSPLFFSGKDTKKKRQEDSYSDPNENYPFYTDSGHPVPLFYNPDKSTFQFLTSSNRRKVQDSQQSRFSWVYYTLESPQETEGESEKDKKLRLETFNLVRYFFPNNPYQTSKIDIDKEKGQVVLNGLKAFEFSFWDPKSKKFVTSLSDVSEKDKVTGKNILRGMKITFTWIDHNKVEFEEERVFRSMWPYFKEKKQKPTNRNKRFNRRN